MVRPNISRSKSKTLRILFAGLAFVFLGSTSISFANSYQAQINELQQENSASARQQEDLEDTATTYEEKLASLSKKISATRGQISDNQSKSDNLKLEIAKNKREVVKQRKTLGENVRQMYLDDQMSTIEKLASSRDFSEYVDKETYNQAVQSKVKTTMDKIEALKKAQAEQKLQIDKLLEDQNAIRTQLSKQESENQRLLGLNKREQATFEGEIKQNNQKIAQLQREQAAANSQGFVGGVSYGGSGRGYPWANVYFPNSLPDPWGMYKRQCVSYTAWRVASSGRHMPYWGGRGNAKLWDDNARAAGIPLDTKPRVGDVAVSNAGYYGHVMYVEAVHRDGTITISQYNAGWDGRYSEGRRSTAGLVFIHF